MTKLQTANLRLEHLNTESAVLWFDVADKKVNVFSRQVLADLETALTKLAKDSACRLLFLRSAKASGFFAGADIQDFATIRSAEEASALSRQGQQLFDQLANLPQTTIAVIHGPCLGGGLEFALACDYRLVIDQPKTQLGVPEIQLGLLPAWGGTQRLPRVVGLEPALRMILGRQSLNAREAGRWGLADAVATEANPDAEIMRLVSLAQRQGKRPKHRLPLLTWRQKLIESNPLGRALIYRGSRRILRERVPDDMPAPAEALEAVRIGIEDCWAAGLAQEQAAIGRLATTAASRNLITLFFLQDKSRKVPEEVRALVDKPIRRVGVVGAGTMGAGIIQLAAIKGCTVVVQEVNDAALAAGMHKVEDLFRKAVANRVLSQAEADRQFAAIERTTAWQGFNDVDLAIEAVLEDLDLKRKVFQELQQRTAPTALLATNTSSLLVAQLQEGCSHPERIGGLHFFNPVHKMPLVEVVRAPATSPATVAALASFTADLGKVGVVVKDSPGFLVNRILMPYLNEAVLLLAGSNARELDRLMQRFGMPMGPLELLDQVGLDVAAHIERSMRPHFIGRFAANQLFEDMSKRGWLGAKTNLGFYRHLGKKKEPNAAVHLASTNAGLRLADQAGAPSKPLNRDESRDRMVLLMVNEAAACLSEGIAADAQTVDLAMVFGTGWAPHRGGPLHYADDRGLSDIVRTLTALAQQYGPRFEPCAELRQRAERGESFYPPLGPGNPSRAIVGVAGS